MKDEEIRSFTKFYPVSNLHRITADLNCQRDPIAEHQNIRLKCIHINEKNDRPRRLWYGPRSVEMGCCPNPPSKMSLFSHSILVSTTEFDVGWEHNKRWSKLCETSSVDCVGGRATQVASRPLSWLIHLGRCFFLMISTNLFKKRDIVGKKLRSEWATSSSREELRWKMSQTRLTIALTLCKEHQGLHESK